MNQREFNNLVSAMGLGMFAESLGAQSSPNKTSSSSTKRVIFFLQNQGFEHVDR